jgi:hypothetical protein
MDPLDWLACMADHIPDPGKHRTHFHAFYASRVRDSRRERGNGSPGRASPRPETLCPELGEAHQQAEPAVSPPTHRASHAKRCRPTCQEPRPLSPFRQVHAHVKSHPIGHQHAPVPLGVFSSRSVTVAARTAPGALAAA